MSSPDGASKNRHLNSKERSDENSTRTSKQRTPSSIDPSSLSQRPPKKTPSLIEPTESSAAPPSSSIAERTSSPKNTYLSHTTSDTGFAKNANNVSSTNVPSSLYHPQMDLSGVSAWTQAHAHLHQGPHCHQTSDSALTSYDTTNTSACLYHTSAICLGYDTTRSRSGFGLVPLERWVEEDANDGGALALQLGLQLRIDCTCIVMQDEEC